MTENLPTLLARANSGIYRLNGRTAAPRLARTADAAGWRFLHLDARTVADKAGFLAAAAQVLRFPEWAGHNWDAFEELVNDLAWLPPAPGYVLLLDHLGRFAARHPEDMAVAVDILRSAVAGRRFSEPALIVLVRGGRAAAHGLPALTVSRASGARGAMTEEPDV